MQLITRRRESNENKINENEPVDGSADLLANRVSARAFSGRVNLTIDFTQCRSNLRITNLVPITTQQYPIGMRQNITTVTLTAGGSGVFTNRNISVEVTLHFQHSLEMDRDPGTAALARPSDLTLTLTGLVSPEGNVTLVGSGTFIGGYLRGSTGSVRVTGRLSPGP